MFGRAFKIGTILGFKIEISFTFLLILAIVAFQAGVVKGLLYGLLIMASVIPHELGHAVVARRLGIRILGIELHILGGAAKMDRMPKTARDEILIALAGPAVSLIMGIAFLGLGFGVHVKLLMYFGAWNLILAGFNLIPALPMDGGRVLRAFLAGRIGRYKATHAAASVAQVFAVIFVIVAITAKMWMLILLALLLWFMASQERRMANQWRYEDEAPVAQVVDQYGNVISEHEGPGTVYTIPNPQNPAPQDGDPNTPATAQQGDGRGPVRRVIRLPNGMVMVVEEHRW